MIDLMRENIVKIIKSVGYSINGLKNAYRRDKSFRMEVWGSVAFLLFGYLFWPLEPYEFLFLLLSFCLILLAELINTAFERALERLHPEHHELIGASKDIASAAVLIAFIFACSVGVIIALNHLL